MAGEDIVDKKPKMKKAMHSEKEQFWFILQHRDKSSALRKIEIEHSWYIPSQTMVSIINCAILYKVEQFKLDTPLRTRNARLFYSMFFLHSLTCLDLSIRNFSWIVQIPENVDLPQLVKCRLRHVNFYSRDDKEFFKPFLNCKKLSTLLIENCHLSDGKILCLVSDKLVNLTILFSHYISDPFKVTILAPNLEAFTFASRLTSNNHEIFEHNLDFIKEANIDVVCESSSYGVAETLKNRFKRFNNVHSLTLCFQTLQALSYIPKFPNIEPIGFGKLQSLIVTRYAENGLPIGVVDYLLQDSPLVECKIIQGKPLYSDYFD